MNARFYYHPPPFKNLDIIREMMIKAEDSAKETTMRFRFLPREVQFYDFFDALADCTIEAAEYFTELVHAGKFDDEAYTHIRTIEHKGDKITHEIMDSLNQTFITPFDREDIHTLAHEMDNIIDLIHTVINRMRLYKLSGVNDDMITFVELINQSVKETAKAVKGLRNRKALRPVMEACIEVNRLENAGDHLRDQVIGKLFEKKKDPIMVIKMKDIYGDAENILDICEDVANIVESILVKQA